MFQIKRRLFSLFIGCLIVALFTCPVHATEDLFVEKCGQCHKRGGEAKVLNPADKAGTVWKRFFKRGRHPVDLSSTISKEELSKIIEYLQNHAADSDQPAAAVIPE